MREGYKNTKLGVIPEDWKIAKLDKLVDTFGGYAFKSSKFNMKKLDKPYQVIRMGNVQMGLLKIKKDPVYLDKMEIDEKKIRYVLNKGDILVSLTGTVNKRDYGNVCYIVEDEKYVVNQRVGCIRNKSDGKKIANKYLYYYMHSNIFRNQFFILGIGGTGNQTNVSLNDMNKIDVILPLYPEQNKIASIISSVDEHIEEVDGIIKDLKELKKGLMQKLLTGQYTIENGKLVKTKEFKKTRLGIIPINWIVEKLENLVTIKSGYSPSKFKLFEEGKYPFFKVDDMNYCNKTLSDAKVYFNKTNFDLMPEGMIVFPKRGASIYTNKVAILGEKAYFDTNIMGLNIDNNNTLDNEFLYYYLKFVKLDKLADITALPQINNKHINPFKILVPTLNEQKQIIRILSNTDDQIELYELEREDFKQLKNGFMQQLLTGKVRVKV